MHAEALAQHERYELTIHAGHAMTSPGDFWAHTPLVFFCFSQNGLLLARLFENVSVPVNEYTYSRLHNKDVVG